LLEEQLELDLDVEARNLSPEYVVTKSNMLIEFPTNLNLNETRIIYTLISLIQPDDDAFKTVFMKVRDIAEILDIREKNLYKIIRETVLSLQSKTLHIPEENGNLLDVNWLSASRYHIRKGMVELEFSPQLKPYLLELKKNFTKFKLANVLCLKSKYSIRMYELLKRYQGIGKRKFNKLEDLRYLLEVEPNKLNHYGHFKKVVLFKAQEELAEKTDITFDFEEGKIGNRVVSITCVIKNNNRIKILSDDDFDMPSIPVHDLLIRFGVKTDVAKDLIENYGELNVRANIQYVFDKKQDVAVDNISGYIVSAIKNNYVNNPDQEEEEDLETSIPNLNQKINKEIDTYHRIAESQKEEDLSLLYEVVNKKLSNWIEIVKSKREYKNMRALVSEDIENKSAKKILANFQW